MYNIVKYIYIISFWVVYYSISMRNYVYIKWNIFLEIIIIFLIYFSGILREFSKVIDVILCFGDI